MGEPAGVRRDDRGWRRHRLVHRLSPGARRRAGGVFEQAAPAVEPSASWASADVILTTVRWYLRHPLSGTSVMELLLGGRLYSPNCS